MITPVAMLILVIVCMFLGRNPGCNPFVDPWATLISSAFVFFSPGLNRGADFPSFFNSINGLTFSIALFCGVWLVIFPLAVYIYKRVKNQLLPGGLSGWKSVGICAYLSGSVVISSIVNSFSNGITLFGVVFVFMLMFIPVIFYHNNIKGMFTRREVIYMLTMVMFAIGYICGIGLELKTVITVCAFPALFYALANWYVRRDTMGKDVLLVVGASVVFWCAQYATNMMRILLLFGSLALMAIPVICFSLETKRKWMSVGAYLVCALILPVFCLGYNPYSVLEAKRYWHYDRYWNSQNGLLCVGNDNTVGLRDRYGVILPVDEYDYFELLTPSRPYCKVRKGALWQIYDIERHELLCDEWFDDIVPCEKFVYRLKSKNGDKYLTMHWYYNRHDKSKSAVISNELPM